jgi:hypothetical protein
LNIIDTATNKNSEDEKMIAVKETRLRETVGASRMNPIIPRRPVAEAHHAPSGVLNTNDRYPTKDLWFSDCTLKAFFYLCIDPNGCISL